MTEKIIPQGYILEITTWENDADNCNTRRMEGLTENEAKFYLTLCRGFACKHYSTDVTFGNSDCSPYGVQGKAEEFVEATCKKFGMEYHEEVLYDLIDCWFEGSRYRVFGGAKLYFTPIPITMQELDAKTF